MYVNLLCKTTKHRFYAVNILQRFSLSRVNEPEQEETDQRVITLFLALNLEALRVAADTLVPRFIPAIPKIVKKIISDQQCQFKSRTNLGCLRRLFRVTILEDEVLC
ncbi:Hypothetical_protein [Hexamita inflata]|uniref:Hypothetical_protein n=1 Tax=Hexamita inflata TaxID=28002 RepID=A0AA86NR58_9EUKA|nr:Hypothetical protein HINF_LOCUS11556 [Hexamita inflata]CAI9924366.1 Hypothetical protein HINF_LOCUS12011 [Hexamita inflata]CAI9925536.1 Hypothetical protein HINF_LOCUS13181 [Hexamita inflata]